MQDRDHKNHTRPNDTHRHSHALNHVVTPQEAAALRLVLPEEPEDTEARDQASAPIRLRVREATYRMLPRRLVAGQAPQRSSKDIYPRRKNAWQRLMSDVEQAEDMLRLARSQVQRKPPSPPQDVPQQ